MRIGIIADGQSEVGALPLLLDKLEIPEVTIINPRFADLQPKATPAQICKAAESRIKALIQNDNVEKIVVLIDLEDRDDCPGDWANAVTQEFRRRGFHDVIVVIKNRKFENWLISDIENIRKRMPGRIAMGEGVIRAIRGSGADSFADAETVLDTACIGKNYNKRKDSVQICRVADPLAIAINSRSFRRFLRVVGHPSYEQQSRRPR